MTTAPPRLRSVIPVVREVTLPAVGVVTLASVDLWTDSVTIHAAYVPGLMIDELLPLHQVWSVSDDVGTPYEGLGAGAAGGNDRRTDVRVTFRPAPPADARKLLVTARRDGEMLLKHAVHLPASSSL